MPNLVLAGAIEPDMGGIPLVKPTSFIHMRVPQKRTDSVRFISDVTINSEIVREPKGVIEPGSF